MSIIYFTLVAILLYLFSDWLLLRIEAVAGKRLEYRSIIFFAILLSLATAGFSIIQFYTGNP